MKKEFYDIVINLARRNNINMSDEELCAEANKWEISHGGISVINCKELYKVLKVVTDIICSFINGLTHIF